MSEITINNPIEPEMGKNDPPKKLSSIGVQKHVIYGDIGGHYNEFIASLHDYGVDTDNYTIPKGTVIVQVGDLVHKGPDSEKIVIMVSAFANKYPEQWIQLIGNHELPYLSKQREFYSGARANKPTRKMIRELQSDKLLKSSYSFTDSQGQDYLVTHAGLTETNYDNFSYRNGLDRPNASQIDSILNNTPLNDMLTAGMMMYGRPNQSASIFWAECASELYYSWLTPEIVAPFHQIHGHSSVRQWGRNGIFRYSYPVWLTESLESDFENMHTKFTLNYPASNEKMAFHAIDHDLGTTSFIPKVCPLVIV